MVLISLPSLEWGNFLYTVLYVLDLDGFDPPAR